MDPAVLQLISGSGAAVVLFWVVFQFVNGKIHNQSEIDAYKKREEDLLRINQKYADQFDAVNDILEKAVDRREYASRSRRSPT